MAVDSNTEREEPVTLRGGGANLRIVARDLLTESVNLPLLRRSPAEDDRLPARVRYGAPRAWLERGASAKSATMLGERYLLEENHRRVERAA
jgi:hypothetical protein